MGYKPDGPVDALLYELCVRDGYCLPPDAQIRLRDHPPESVDAWVDAILQASAIDPLRSDRATRRRLADAVRRWMNPTNDRTYDPAHGAHHPARHP